MFAIRKETHLSLLAIHGWSAIILGLFLYLVIITGTIAVFADEISGWASPAKKHAEQLMPAGTGAKIAEMAATVPEENLEEVFLFPSSSHRLRVFFHGHHEEETSEEQPSEETHEQHDILMVLDTSTMELMQHLEGDDLFSAVKADALADFIVDLHVRLLMPNRWGLFLTGLLGFAMMAAVVSGFIMHRHLIAELFTQRRKSNPVLQSRDKHVVASSWNLPFAFLLAFTGAFFSFGGALGLPALAFVAFGGDVESAQEAILAPIQLEDDRLAPLVNLDTVLQDARKRANAEPNTVQVRHWGRADAHIQVLFDTPQKQLTSEIYNYNGTSGEFLGAQPRIGREESLGGALTAIMDPLHFGDFAGLFSKTVWFSMGCATAYVTLSGLVLWGRRRDQTTRGRRFTLVTEWLGYGLPTSLIGVFCTYFLLIDIVSPDQLRATLSYVFLSFLVLSAIPCGIAPAHTKGSLLLTSALLLVALPLCRMSASGISWFSESGQQSLVISGDLLALIIACACFYASHKAHQGQNQQAPTVAKC